MSGHSSVRRLFVALWPPPVVQKALAALARDETKGMPVAASNIHLTLAFLGHCTQTQEKAYRTALAGVIFPPLHLTIDTLGFWRLPRVLWAGSQSPSPELTALAQDIQQRLQACGFIPETRPFHAHITLKRKYPGPMPAWGMRLPVIWHADTVALVLSQSTPHGVRYQPLMQIAAQP